MQIQWTKATLIGLAAAALAGAAAAPALAHHSFAMFDNTIDKTLTGTVKKFDWTNPHTFIWLDTSATETWAIEGMSPNFLARRGWSKRTINPGDKISVTLHPLKDGSKGGSFMRLTLPNGQTMSMSGQAQPAQPAPN